MKTLILTVTILFSNLAGAIVLDPDLKTRQFRGEVFIPFIYNFRTDEIHWTIGAGSELADGSPHPDAADVWAGVHSELKRLSGASETRDWGGGGFLYDPTTQRLMFAPVRGLWSGGMNLEHWKAASEAVRLLPWQYVEVSMISAMKHMLLRFQPNPDPFMGYSDMLTALEAKGAFPSDMGREGREAAAKYFTFVATNPEKVLSHQFLNLAGIASQDPCEGMLKSLTKTHPTSTPMVLGRGRLGSAIPD